MFGNKKIDERIRELEREINDLKRETFTAFYPIEEEEEKDDIKLTTGYYYESRLLRDDEILSLRQAVNLIKTYLGLEFYKKKIPGPKFYLKQKH